MSGEAQRNCRVVHRLTRRVRLLAPPLVRNAERCYILEILLRKRPEISEVRAVPDIGSLAIHYDPRRLPEQRLLAIVDGLLDNLIACPPARPAAAVATMRPCRNARWPSKE
jgi:Cu+-exporting ATPase